MGVRFLVRQSCEEKCPWYVKKKEKEGRKEGEKEGTKEGEKEVGRERKRKRGRERWVEMEIMRCIWMTDFLNDSWCTRTDGHSSSPFILFQYVFLFPFPCTLLPTEVLYDRNTLSCSLFREPVAINEHHGHYFVRCAGHKMGIVSTVKVRHEQESTGSGTYLRNRLKLSMLYWMCAMSTCSTLHDNILNGI